MANIILYSFKRYEKKYLLTPYSQIDLLRQLQPYIQEDAYGKYTICNIYYDTDDWHLIRESIEKPVYKEKLRVRSYGTPTETDTVFIELKRKCNGTVYKRRISTEEYIVEPFLYGLQEENRYGQIGQEILWFQGVHKTVPKVFIAYDRIAFTGREDANLRITFDTNMRWRDTDLDLCMGDYGTPLLSTDQILMEIKMPGSCPLWLSRMLSKAGIYPTSFSKYGKCYCDKILKNETIKKEAFYCA